MTETPQSPDTHQWISLEISNGMVRLYKELFGRGPSRARTYFAGPDIVICSLETSFTPAERSMAEMGEHQRLREWRSLLQYGRATEFCSPIERITGRTVRAFISGTDTEADGLSVETFVLHPPGYDGPSRCT